MVFRMEQLRQTIRDARTIAEGALGARSVCIVRGGENSTTINLHYNAATFGPVTTSVELGDSEILRLQPGVSSQEAALNQDGTAMNRAHPCRATGGCPS